MKSLPTKIPYDLMLTTWSSALTPLLRNKLTDGNLIQNIAIIAGVNNINHLLQRQQQGFIITDIDAPAQLYRSQAFNQLTLTLTSDAPCTISVWCF